MKFILTFLATAFAIITNAQLSVPYKLDPKPDFTKYLADIKKENSDEIGVLTEVITEYAYDKDGNLLQYYFHHAIKYVNSADAVDRNNKIYVSLRGAIALDGFDARVVLPNGTVKSMGDEALREGTNEDGVKITYFAISGAEKGSFIEYYYLIKKNPNLSGSTITLQSKYKTLEAKVKIISPDNLLFTSKSFNGFAELKGDSSLSERNMLLGVSQNIPGIEDEDFSNEGANTMKVIYQLYYNTAKRKINPFNYGLASQNIFESISGKLDKDDIKVCEKILKQSEIKYAPDPESKLRAIENYVKENYGYTESDDDKYEIIQTIQKEHLMSESGATRLLYNLCTMSEIETEIVVTTNRFNTRFDPVYESYAFLGSYLLYFPQFKKFMNPSDYTYRLGLTPFINTNNNGLFIRKVSVGEISTGAGKIKFIPALTSDQTQHNTKVFSKLDASLDSIEVDLSLEFTGYYARSFQPYYDNIPKAKLREYEEEILKSWNKDITIKTTKSENGGAKNMVVKPLIVSGKVTSQQFVEKAGNRLLVKIGDMIGPQAELYQKGKRTLPVENDYNREYHRVLVFEIPEGYTIKNLNELNMSVQPFKNSGDGAGFTSSYSIEGNKLKILCDEYYKQLEFKLDEYEAYRTVINAAANFNKITLLLDKTK